MAGPPLHGLMDYLRHLTAAPAPAADWDSHLLERYLRGRDEDAFAALVRRHGPGVLAVCRRLLGEEQDAEDAFQATFLVLARKAASVRKRASLGSWLYGVAYRVALRARAAAARRRRHERRAAPGQPADPAAEAARAELAAVLAEEVGGLPEKYRAPVVLCYLEGRTFTEAAELLGWPAGTVSSRLARAREVLRKRLTRRGLAVSGTLPAAEAPAAVPSALMIATVKAATAQAAGRAAGEVSPAAAALTEGVLRAMFLNQLKTVAVVLLVLGALAAAGVLSYPRVAARQNEGAAPAPAPVPEKPQPAVKPEDKLPGLLKERVEAARTMLKARTAEYEAGRGTLDILLEASRLMLQAELEASDKKDDQIAALEAYVKRAKDLEELNKQKYKEGRLSLADLAQSTYYRAEAEILLERAKAKN